MTCRRLAARGWACGDAGRAGRVGRVVQGVAGRAGRPGRGAPGLGWRWRWRWRARLRSAASAGRPQSSVGSPTCDQESGDRALQLYPEHGWDHRCVSAVGSCRGVGGLLDIRALVLRGWLQQAEIDAGARAGVTGLEDSDIVWLRNQNAQPRRAQEISATKSVFFPASTARPQEFVIAAYVHVRKGRFGSVAVCLVLVRAEDPDRAEGLLHAVLGASVRRGWGRRPCGERLAGLVAQQPAGVAVRRTGHSGTRRRARRRPRPGGAPGRSTPGGSRSGGGSQTSGMCGPWPGSCTRVP